MDNSNNIIDSSSHDVSDSHNTSAINKITLELLINKKQYNKYLSITDTIKYQEHKTHLTKIEIYLEKILEITSELLYNPDKQMTTDVNESFNAYVKTCIQYIEMKEYENKCNNNYNNEDSDDDEMLFGNMDDLPKKTESYWGRKVHRIDHMNTFFTPK